MKVLILVLLLNSFAVTIYANRCEKYLSHRKKNSLSLVVNNSDRFTDPQIKRLIPLETTKELFEALNRGQVLHYTIFNRVVNVPTHLAKKIQRISVVIRVSNPIDVDYKDLIELPERQSILNSKLNPWISIELRDASVIRVGDQRERDYAKFFPEFNYKEEVPITDRLLAEKFMFRSSIYKVLNTAASKIPGSEILTGNRVSAWNSGFESGLKPVELFIDVKNLTHAEFATVLNELALYLDARSKK